MKVIFILKSVTIIVVVRFVELNFKMKFIPSFH